MARVELQTPAPQFEATDFKGDLFRLADWRNRRHLVLVFNRGFL